MGRGERGCEPNCRKNRTIERSQLALAVCLEYARPAVHVLAHAINQALGNAGATVAFAPPVEAAPAQQPEHCSRSSVVEPD